MLNRRHILRALPLLLAAPAIVRASSLMAVRPVPPSYWAHGLNFTIEGQSNWFSYPIWQQSETELGPTIGSPRLQQLIDKNRNRSYVEHLAEMHRQYAALRIT